MSHVVTNRSQPRGRPVAAFISTPAALAIVSAFLGLLAGVLSTYVTSSTRQLSLLVGLVTAVLAFQVGELVKAAATTPRLSQLERGLTDARLFEYLTRAIAAHEAAQSPIGSKRLGILFLECLEHLWNADEWIEIPLGRAAFNEARELTLNRDLLAVADVSVDAVAFGDEEFWARPEGVEFINQTDRAIKDRGLRVTRVFVMDEAALQNQRSIIEGQAAKGIICRVLPPTSQTDDDREDFVMYDRKAVRYARPVSVSSLLKKATLSVDGRDLQHYRTKYESLLQRSTPYSEFYAKIGGASASSL